MKVTRQAADAFLAEFESAEELREEHRINLAHNALRLPTSERVPLHTALSVTLRGPGGDVTMKATVVAALPDGPALMIEGNPDEILQRLLETPETSQNPWDRMRSLSQMEKILLAAKADRSERALLLQDNDPRVLLSVLRNPRLTVEEVARMAKSSFLNYQIADVIIKTTQWMASMDVRVALVHNPKTPQAMALRILPSLPVNEVRNIARAGTSMALKQAALKLVQGGK